VFDRDDLRVLAQGAILILVLLVAFVAFAFAVGLAWNVFDLVRGV
jgi:hypothetical protein